MLQTNGSVHVKLLSLLSLHIVTQQRVQGIYGKESNDRWLIHKKTLAWNKINDILLKRSNEFPKFNTPLNSFLTWLKII